MNKTVKAKKKLHECKNFSWTLITEGGRGDSQKLSQVVERVF